MNEYRQKLTCSPRSASKPEVYEEKCTPSPYTSMPHPYNVQNDRFCPTRDIVQLYGWGFEVWAGGAFLFIDLKCRCRTGAPCELLATFGHIWSHGTSDHKGPLHHPRKHPVNTLFKNVRYGRLEIPPPCKRAARVCTSTTY